MLSLTPDEREKLLEYYQSLDAEKQYQIYQQASKQPKEVIEQLLKAA